jgi:two-component system, chemotaxis family, response regulator WspR
MSGASVSAARPPVVLLVDRDAASAAAVRRALNGSREVTLEVCAEPSRAAESARTAGASVVLVAADACENGELPRLFDGVSPALPVLVLAHRASPAFRRRMFAAGAVDCLLDLPDPEELAARLRAHARAVLAERERDEARQQLEKLRRRLEERELNLANGIASRSRLDEFLDGEWRRARRNGSHLSLVIVEAADLGEAADAVTRLAVALKGALRRGGDLLGSCGDNRFAAVLPEVGAAGASTVARALRQAAATAFPAARLRQGVATLRPQEVPTAASQSLLTQAEAALTES